MPRSWRGRSSDLDAAFVSNNYATGLAGLKLKDALLVEGRNSEWTLVFAAREDRKDDPAIRSFIATYRSEPVKKFIEKKFQGLDSSNLVVGTVSGSSTSALKSATESNLSPRANGAMQRSPLRRDHRCEDSIYEPGTHCHAWQLQPENP